MGGYGSGRPAMRVVMMSLTISDGSTFGGCRGRTDYALARRASGHGRVAANRKGKCNTAWPTTPSSCATPSETMTTKARTCGLASPFRSLPCRYGGSRTYLLCPHCCRMCEVIVMTTNGRRWGCRKCLRLHYQSQRLAPADRMQRRADALYERAGTDSGDGMVIKRKGMRWRTFNRLMDHANALSTGGPTRRFCVGCNA
jgi:hypothetical protein